MSWQRSVIVVLIGAAGALSQGVADSSKKWVSKCLDAQKIGRLGFHCPKHHVLEDIYMVYGIRPTNTTHCSYSSNDCHVRPVSLKQWTNECRWRKSCDLFPEDLNLNVAGNEKDSTCGKNPSYISFLIPKCLPEDRLFYLCPGKNKPIKAKKGMINSECKKSTSFRKVKCKRRFRWPANSTVTFLMKGKSRSESVRLIWRENGKTERFSLKNGIIQTFIVPNRDISLLWKSRVKKHTRQNLEVFFRVTSPGQVDDKLDDTEFYNKNDSLLHLQQISTVTANVTEDVEWEKKSLTFTCPQNSVIYSASLTLGKLSDPGDGERLLECPGKSSELLMQESECHWQRSCDITWDAPSPIISSNRIRCFGKPSEIIEYHDFKCVPQDSVLDMCNKKKTISVPRGVIRSHSNYPWNYVQIHRRCRRHIQVMENETLVLRVAWIDIDQTRDKLSIKHGFNETCQRRLSTEKLRQGELFRFGSGQLNITFRTSGRSRSGKGFLILLEKRKSLYGGADPICTSRSSRGDNGQKSKGHKKKFLKMCKRLEKCSSQKRYRKRCTRLMKRYGSKCQANFS